MDESEVQIESRSLELIEGTANMMRGMALDQTVPLHARLALQVRIQELERFLELTE